MHDVQADYKAVTIDYKCSILTFAYGADVALRHTVASVGIACEAELIVSLLLHVVAHDASLGYIAPQVVISVYV